MKYWASFLYIYFFTLFITTFINRSPLVFAYLKCVRLEYIILWIPLPVPQVLWCCAYTNDRRFGRVVRIINNRRFSSIYYICQRVLTGWIRLVLLHDYQWRKEGRYSSWQSDRSSYRFDLYIERREREVVCLIFTSHTFNDIVVYHSCDQTQTRLSNINKREHEISRN